MLLMCPNCFAPATGKRCLICRKNKYYLANEMTIATCKSCGTITRLAGNGDCKPCLKKAGLKECTHCHEVGLALLDFKTKQAKCRRCRLRRPSASREQRQARA
jgi:hypothetical protein